MISLKNILDIKRVLSSSYELTLIEFDTMTE